MQKVQDLCQRIYPKEKPLVKLFGSLTTGLALESSDMDLAIQGLYIPDRDDMIEKLKLMAKEIKTWPFIAKMKAIPTASIPVIKVVSIF